MEPLAVSEGQHLLVVDDSAAAGIAANSIDAAKKANAQVTVWKASDLAANGDKAQFKGTFDAAIAVGLGDADDAYFQIYETLKPNASATIVQKVSNPSEKDGIVSAVLLGTFTVDDSATKITDSLLIVSAAKKTWSEQPAVLSKASGTAKGKRALYAALANDVGGDADDLVDEDALLGEAPAAPKPAGCAPAAPGTRKRACKNCTCGSFLLNTVVHEWFEIGSRL